MSPVTLEIVEALMHQSSEKECKKFCDKIYNLLNDIIAELSNYPAFESHHRKHPFDPHLQTFHNYG